MSLLNTLNTDFIQDIIELHNEGVIGFMPFQVITQKEVVKFDILLSPLASSSIKKSFLNNFFEHYGLDVVNVNYDKQKQIYQLECFDKLGRVNKTIFLYKGNSNG